MKRRRLPGVLFGSFSLAAGERNVFDVLGPAQTEDEGRETGSLAGVIDGGQQREQSTRLRRDKRGTVQLGEDDGIKQQSGDRDGDTIVDNQIAKPQRPFV